MAEYNRWMNDRLYAAAATLEPAALTVDKGAFFGSILGTLNHIAVADTIWLHRFAQHEAAFPVLGALSGFPRPSSLTQPLAPDLAGLGHYRRELDALIERWVAGLTPEHLSADLAYSNMAGVHSSPVFWGLAAALLQSPDAPPRSGHDVVVSGRRGRGRHRSIGGHSDHCIRSIHARPRPCRTFHLRPRSRARCRLLLRRRRHGTPACHAGADRARIRRYPVAGALDSAALCRGHRHHLAAPAARGYGAQVLLQRAQPGCSTAGGAGAGGEVFAENWQGPGFTVCNGMDPEGNVFQVREFAA
jgi:uncharacterized damage-inducible protein DinB